MGGWQGNLIELAYLGAAVFFILCLAGLSDQEKARRGNLFGVLGMTLAIGATVSPVLTSPWSLPLVAAAAGIGAVVGAVMAVRVAMTAMPEMVALLHSFVGAAAVLVGISQMLGGHLGEGVTAQVHLGAIAVDILIGAITFTGSIVAFLKLRGTWGGGPLRLPGRHVLNVGMAAVAIVASIFAIATGITEGLYLSLFVSCVLGVTLIGSIGGADMPVAVSLLNSYSGWTASAAGFVLGNDLLIVTGALVGSSGAILSYIMCKAMNRSIWNVVFGDVATTSTALVGASSGLDPALKAAVDRGVNVASVEETIDILRSSTEVVIVPGYGMAVAQAQNAVRDLTRLLEGLGCRVRFAIHPVAGRLPGHMNVLLAEANVPYDQVLEMDDINQDLPHTDAVLVIGANDIVNPSALEDRASPLYGMPTLEVHKSRVVYVVKRSLAAGYSGVDNPLYYRDNTQMVFGDARKVVEDMVRRLKEAA